MVLDLVLARESVGIPHLRSPRIFCSAELVQQMG